MQEAASTWGAADPYLIATDNSLILRAHSCADPGNGGEDLGPAKDPQYTGQEIMSRALQGFEHGIKDAEELLAHFDGLNSSSPPPQAEVLKRAGLVMALTAWETYVEDRIQEEMSKRLNVVSGSYVGNFIFKRLETELKQFHNPNADKTRKLFLDYLDIDVTLGWCWANVTPDKAKAQLNQWIAKRGDAVHRSKPVNNGVPPAHLVKRDELEKVIRFLKELVKATDSVLEKH